MASEQNIVGRISRTKPCSISLLFFSFLHSVIFFSQLQSGNLFRHLNTITLNSVFSTIRFARCFIRSADGSQTCLILALTYALKEPSDKTDKNDETIFFTKTNTIYNISEPMTRGLFQKITSKRFHSNFSQLC